MRKIKIIIVLISAVFVNITVLNAQQWAPINNDIYFPFTGNVGISTTPNYKLDMYGTGSKAGIHLYKGGGVTASWYFNPGSLETGEFSIANDDITALTILPNGNIGIGTIIPDQALTVNGKIHAKEVIIDVLYPFVPDFVFKPTYKLMPLNQVEQYVNSNSHLPEIPSASEVSKNGLNMGDMQNKLLQKIEELTLYSIQQEKQYNALLKKVEMLTKLIEKQ